MSKDMFYAAINNIEKEIIDIQSPNVIFIGSNSKAELLYKNVPCKVIEKNYRYVLDTKDEIKQNDDLFSIFEKSLLVQKTLIESPESKIVFSIDYGCIFNARAREFTNWLKSIDKSFGSHNLFNSSCLVIESVSKDSDPILELQSLIKDSFGRISDVNLKLLDSWLVNEKIKLIQNFSKKDLGEYDGTYFQKELGAVLQKCSSVSYLDSKPFLPSETIDSQRAFYKEISNEIFGNSKNFAATLYENLAEAIRKDACTYDFNKFEKKYHNMLTKLDVQENQIYKSMINLCLTLDNEPLQKIAEYVKQLEETEGKITNLMRGVLDLHDPDMYRLDFENNINNLKNELKNNWDKSIFQANEAVRASCDLYTLFELNGKCKLDSKKIGYECYLKKRDAITEQESDKLLESHKELRLNLNKLNDFCHSDNHLKQAVIKNIEAYSNLTPLHKVIYQSIIASSIDKNLDTSNSFINSYVLHVKSLYSQLYDEYAEVITNLEKEYHECAWFRENIEVFGGRCIGGGTVVGGVVAGGIALSGGTGLIFLLAGIPSLIGGIGGYIKKKQISENSDSLLKYSFKSVEQYYKQLPKDLREGWADINMFPKLSEYLKEAYPANKIYLHNEEQHNENFVSGSMLDIEESKELNELSSQTNKFSQNQNEELLLQSNDGVLLSGNNMNIPPEYS